MSSYYKLNVDIRLKPIEEIGEHVHKLLLLLFEHESMAANVHISDRPRSFLPDHPFWTTERFYHIGATSLCVDGKYENSDYQHPLLKVRCDINYGYQEILMFLDWITPYVDSVPEPGEYDDENTEASHIEVTFEPSPEGRMQFCFIEHDSWCGGWVGQESKEKKVWVEQYPAPSKDYSQKKS